MKFFNLKWHMADVL